jgi:hypothetical protein
VPNEGRTKFRCLQGVRLSRDGILSCHLEYIDVVAWRFFHLIEDKAGASFAKSCSSLVGLRAILLGLALPALTGVFCLRLEALSRSHCQETK